MVVMCNFVEPVRFPTVQLKLESLSFFSLSREPYFFGIYPCNAAQTLFLLSLDASYKINLDFDKTDLVNALI